MVGVGLPVAVGVNVPGHTLDEGGRGARGERRRDAGVGDYLPFAEASDVPLGVVTVTSTDPVLPAGAVAVIDVAESAVVARAGPRSRPRGRSQVSPGDHHRRSTGGGAGGRCEARHGRCGPANRSLARWTRCHPAVVAWSRSAPPAGAVAVIDVAESAVGWCRCAPKTTAVAKSQVVPVITTDVPPEVGPWSGWTLPR